MKGLKGDQRGGLFGFCGRRGAMGQMGGLGIGRRTGTVGLCGNITIFAPYRLLSGVRSIGFHVFPGAVVGGSRVLSGTVA